MTTSTRDLLNQKKQKIADKRMGSKNSYKFKGGVTTIRILPGWRADKTDPTFFHDFGQTFIKDMDKNTLAVVGDRLITYGEDDAVRSLIQKAKADAITEAQREHWKEMLASPRILVNALILDDKEVSATEPQIVEFSEAQFDSILGQIDLAGIADEFLDLNEGFNLKVSKSGLGMKTRYSFSFERKPSSVDESVLEGLIDIDAYIRSKFADTERAVNAIKSITQGSSVSRPALSYSGGSDTDIQDGEYSAVDSALAPWEDETPTVDATSTEIDDLFKD